ncbi:hypothetical protein SAMN05443582_101725 [Phyllobacterium sp. OV277]|jgi:hypothetical protein|nr:hypothetical protein SAMN05443582_101725 [Phyllobacterium sp. OV277]
MPRLHGAWFDKLTMRGLDGCNDNRRDRTSQTSYLIKVAELDSPQSSLSLMVSLSNHEPCYCNHLFSKKITPTYPTPSHLAYSDGVLSGGNAPETF